MHLTNFKIYISALLVVFMTTFTAKAQQFNASQYIEKHKDLAQRLMNEHGVPASVILAVAMHESANGGSKIAKHLNNHFGIKGSNNSRVIKSAYKGYGSVLDSYNDFVAFLKRRARTQPLFEEHPGSNSKAWVQTIARSGYSSTKSWSSQVLATINRNNLTIYDKETSPIETPVAQVKSTEPKKTSSTTTIYRVKKGDNLSTIAKRHRISISQLKSKNNLSSTKLSIGQKLKI